jgi:hypothetical protein
MQIYGPIWDFPVWDFYIWDYFIEEKFVTPCVFICKVNLFKATCSIIDNTNHFVANTL